MVTESHVLAAHTERKWRTFYETMRLDMIEAQCALESGRVIRASELLDKVMRDARRFEHKVNPSAVSSGQRGINRVASQKRQHGG